MTDAETSALVAAAAAGSGEAFTALVRAHHDLVFRWALAVSGEPDQADDLAQEVWIRAFRGLHGYRGTSKFTTWLYRITYNTVASSERKRKRQAVALAAWHQGHDDPAEMPVVTEALDRERLVAALRQVLGDLPPRQRAALALADLDGLTIAEIADRMEITESTVRVTLFKARQAVRGRLHQQEPRLIEEHGA